MRLLRWTIQNQISLTQDLDENERPPYAILSHTWAQDNSEEVLFAEVETDEGRRKKSYEKIRFCAEQAREDGINHFWIDTCCIDKTNHVELSEAITSMYRWYQNAAKCYVYLADVLAYQDSAQSRWESSFRSSRWFTRGWTLQELLAPGTVEFFSCEGTFLGNKDTLAQQIQAITSIPYAALRGTSLSQFPVNERMRWATIRQTKKPEDRAYCLLGIFDVSIAVIYGEGEEKAFRRLQKEIREQSDHAPLPTHVHWLVPRTPNPLFTGRQYLLKELEETVRGAVYCPWDRDQCRVVIYGLGGQGKSELCLQLARRLRQIFWAVLWIDVRTTDDAERSFLEAAQKLSLPAKTWNEAVSGLSNLKHPCLIVLDNADDPEVDYQDYLPDSRYIVILMTTRNKECELYSTDRTVALEALDITEAQDLLLKAARISTSQHSTCSTDANRVAALLQSHPLALVQAGAYMARGHCTLADYPRIYESQRQRLLTFRPSQARSGYRDVYATFEVSTDMLVEMDTVASRDALQLLPLLAVCGPRQFPLWTFEASWQRARVSLRGPERSHEDESDRAFTPWHFAQLPTICDASAETCDSYRITEAVSLLKAFSLISVDTYDGLMYVSFHPLVHVWARDRQDHLQQQRAWLQIGCVIAFVLDDVDARRNQNRQLQPHVEALFSWGIRRIFSMGPKVSIGRIIVLCGRLLFDQRAGAKLLTLMDEIFMTLKLDKFEAEQPWIGLYCLAAENFCDCDMAEEAVALLEAVVKIDEQTLAEDHLDRLNSQHALASAYIDNCQSQEAIVLLKAIIRTKKQILAEDHSSRLDSEHALAIAYIDNGQTAEAIGLLTAVLSIEERILAEDHPDRVSTQYQLARAYVDNGQFKEATGLLQAVMKIEERTLDEDDSSRLDAQYELARVYAANERPNEAIVLLQAIAKIEQRTLADDHPRRLASQYLWADCLWEVGAREAALSLMGKVVSIERKVLHEHHPDRQQSEERLALFEHEVANITLS